MAKIASVKRVAFINVPYAKRYEKIYLAFIAGVIGWLIERMRGGRARTATGDSVLEWKLITVFWCVSFVIWTAIYSIYRYLVPLELQQHHQALGERQKIVALSLREREAHLAERDEYIRVTYLLPLALCVNFC